MNETPTPGAFGRIHPVREDWLSRAEPEQILEPDLPIIDTHHHLWDRPGRHYLLPDLLTDLNSGHNIVATVYAECGSMYRDDGPQAMRAVGEIEFVAGVAQQCEQDSNVHTRVAAGMTGFVDLTAGDAVKPALEAMIEAGGGRFRGVRHSGNWHADPIIGNSHHGGGAAGLYLRDDYRRGLSTLSGLGLSLDAWVYFTQLEELVGLARAQPEASLIVNHICGPLGYGPYTGKTDEVFSIWQAGMRELARCSNVDMKLGGMMMRLATYDYHHAERPITSQQLAELWRPWIATTIELFGAHRCTFESNFPVDKMGIGYAELWNAFKRIAAECSPDEKHDLFSGTARRAYRLD